MHLNLTPNEQKVIDARPGGELAIDDLSLKINIQQSNLLLLASHSKRKES